MSLESTVEVLHTSSGSLTVHLHGVKSNLGGVGTGPWDGIPEGIVGVTLMNRRQQ